MEEILKPLYKPALNLLLKAKDALFLKCQTSTLQKLANILEKNQGGGHKKQFIIIMEFRMTD